MTLIKKKPKVHNNRRGRLTPKEVASLALKQGGRCGCGCGKKLKPGEIDQEHSVPVALGGPSKPDSLWLRSCHRSKTAKDRAAIAKANRLSGKTGKNKPGKKRRRIQSRGFDKRFRKKISGAVIPAPDC